MHYVTCYVTKMSGRKLAERNIRKLTKVGGKSIAVTIPIEYIQKLAWKEKQKVVVNLKGNKIIVEDWK